MSDIPFGAWTTLDEAKWDCGYGHVHPSGVDACPNDDNLPNHPEMVLRPNPNGAGAPRVETRVPRLILTLPNFTQVILDVGSETSIGRGTEGVIGQSLIWFKDVSRFGQLIVSVDEDAAFFSTRPDVSPVYNIPKLSRKPSDDQSVSQVEAPEYLRAGGEEFSDVSLHHASGEERIFCLGQCCFIRFAWEVL